MLEIGSPESTQLACLQTNHKAIAGILREGFARHLREGLSVFAVE
jgi:hypothetical protein